jgi:LuxR family maltose regulon positive regulatory protein
LKSEMELQTLGGHIAAVRAYTNWIGDKRDIAASAAQVALEWLPADERLIRCQAATLLGLTLPNFEGRTQAFKQALAYARECPVSHVTIFAHGCWAWYLAMKGSLHEAHAACLEAIRLSKLGSSYLSLPTLSHVYTTLSAILLEWNQLEGALHYAKEAVDLARRWEQADALHFALDNYGYVLFASGNVDGAFDILRQAWQVARRTSPWFEQITLSQEVEWNLTLGNLDAALQCLRLAQVEMDESANISFTTFKSMLIPLTLVKIYLAQKQYAKARNLGARLSEVLENNQIGHYRIRLFIWLALAYYGLKQESQALASLKDALTLAAPGGYIHVFMIECPKIIPLLRLARTAGIMPEYVDQLLDVYEHSVIGQSIQPVTIPGLIESLSTRELDVLKLLAQGCTDKKIAEALVIARETVHKHLKNIYGKLDVHSRTEAIVSARKLGLL